MTDKTYNGHKNWTHWNVSLWINNEEPLYRRARELVERHGVNKAAYLLSTELPAKTPDGARYSVTAIKAAIDDILS